ncbi:MAG TPA: DNA polymerase III subunit gamma/tau C-terminal domain-containing protein [Burkholderiales bacterium]|nr:DNA polymerase III subunit gamma/tau C-terminal domain-containing protein [Burkholderiales bacterium]
MLAFQPEGSAQPSHPGRPEAERPASRRDDWPSLVQALPPGAARELARNAELRRRDHRHFELLVPKAKAYLAERGYQEKLKVALEGHLGAPVTLKVSTGEGSGASVAALEAGERDARRAEANRAVQSDGFVKDLVNLFDAKVVDSTPREDRK